jgi:hypothetical protein
MDYLRRNGLKVGRVYEARLIKARRAELKRLLSLCRDYHDTMQWAGLIDTYASEDYLADWYKGLYIDAGLPRAKSQARDLSRGKATPTEDYWLDELGRYAEQNAGERIVLVQDTFKESLVKVVRGVMEAEPEIGIEKLAKQIVKGYQSIELWQARRIAQTETMIGLAEAGNIAAQSLEVRVSKQWATSGLTNTRDSHLAMDGVIVEDFEPFQLDDCMMMYPHDASMGAPAGEIINCACDCIRRPI